MSIQKLKIKTAEEVKKELKDNDEMGGLICDVFGAAIGPQMPSKEEVMDKINEIIEHINKLEEGR